MIKKLLCICSSIERNSGDCCRRMRSYNFPAMELPLTAAQQHIAHHMLACHDSWSMDKCLMKLRRSGIDRLFSGGDVEFIHIHVCRTILFFGEFSIVANVKKKCYSFRFCDMSIASFCTTSLVNILYRSAVSQKFRCDGEPWNSVNL